jgi:hypothetical protein
VITINLSFSGFLSLQQEIRNEFRMDHKKM